MSGVAVFVLIVVVVLLAIFFAPSMGVASRLKSRRTEQSSDREMGLGDQAGDTDRPAHKGPVPEQEEREKGTLYPPS